MVLIDRLAIEINRHKRRRRLKGTYAASLGSGYLDSLELIELIKNENADVKVIFDAGANIGTWTLLVKSFFNDAAIHAFEPLQDHIDKFKNTTHKLTKITIHPFCLGSENTTSLFNISSFSDSSSILNATPLEAQQFGYRKINEETVSVKRIDTLIEQNILPVPDIIKLDVQGFELEIIKGMGQYLNQVSYLIVEVSFREYYYGQALFLEIANYLSAYNFTIHAFGQSTPVGKVLGQIDVLFKRI